jgi:deazaflavin-dependent oxidoreductase (nitroreductase family)
MFPREGSAIYSLIRSEGKEQKRVLRRWKWINRVVKVLYLSGILPLVAGDFILLLFTEGRKSRIRRINPLEYRMRDGVIHIFSARGKNADWFKNMMAKPKSVLVKVRFRSFTPEIIVIKKINEKEDILRWYISKYSRAAKFLFGWDTGKDDPEKTNISSILKFIEIVQLKEPNLHSRIA